MRNVWLILVAILALTSGSCSLNHHAPAAQQAAERAEALWHDDSQSHQQQAALSAHRDAFRLGSTRPQRLLPSAGAKHERSSGKLSHGLSVHNHSPLKRTFGPWAGKTTSPLRPCLSRDYYVIALRHILR